MTAESASKLRLVFSLVAICPPSTCTISSLAGGAGGVMSGCLSWSSVGQGGVITRAIMSWVRKQVQQVDKTHGRQRTPGPRAEAERGKKASPVHDGTYLEIDMLSGLPFSAVHDRRLCLRLRLHELPEQRRHLIGFGIQREVAGVEDRDPRVRHVLAIPFRLAEIERGIMLAPEDQQLGLRLLEPGLPLGIRRDVRAVVVEEIGLNLRLAWRVQK